MTRTRELIARLRSNQAEKALLAAVTVGFLATHLAVIAGSARLIAELVVVVVLTVAVLGVLAPAGVCRRGLTRVLGELEDGTAEARLDRLMAGIDRRRGSTS